MAIVNGLKISQLDTATEFQPTDLFAVARGSKTYKLLGSAVISKITATQRYEAILPNSTSRNINIVHNLNTTAVHVTVFENTTNGQIVFPTVSIIGPNTVRLTFRSVPASQEYRVLVTK